MSTPCVRCHLVVKIRVFVVYFRLPLQHHAFDKLPQLALLWRAAALARPLADVALLVQH